MLVRKAGSFFGWATRNYKVIFFSQPGSDEKPFGGVNRVLGEEILGAAE